MIAKLNGLIAAFYILMISPSIVISNDIFPSSEGVNISASALLMEADFLFDGGQYDRAIETYMRAIDSSRAEGDKVAMTEACAMIARTYLAMGRKEEGRPWLEKAAERAVPNEPLGWSRYLGARERFEWKDFQHSKAVATCKEIFQYCSEHKLHERAAEAACVLSDMGMIEDQIEWALKGMKEAEVGNVTRWQGPLWNNLGQSYERLKKYNEAFEAYQRAHEYHSKYGDRMNKLRADWALGHAYRLIGDAANAAVWITLVMLRQFEALDDTAFVGWTLKELGEIAFLKSQPDSALALFKRAKPKLELANIPIWDPDNFWDLLNKIAWLEGEERR